jgi:hydroxypyruvate reductase
VPDETSAAAGQAAIDLVRDLGPDDRLIALISGGGSALMVAPAAGLTLADKAQVNQLLLASGMDISDMNLIRQQLSQLKGGGLLHHAAPARVEAFILSDVIGDDLRAIASGPTVAPMGTPAQAQSLLQAAGLWPQLPAAVRDHLTHAQQPGQSQPPAATNTLIGSNRHSLKAMLDAIPAGWEASIISDQLTGDVAQAAETILAAAKTAAQDHPVALIFGGETTVQLRGTGLGGRNQELALRMAQLGAEQLSGNWLFLSGGTDGRDGPTPAAGGIATPQTWARIRAAGLSPDDLLANNDSHAALQAADALLMTGGTGTNVADVQVFLRQPG